MSVGNPALASPVLPPRSALRPATPPVILPPTKEIVRPETQPSMVRRDPFARVPVRPRAPINVTGAEHPAVHARGRAGTLALPKISARFPSLTGLPTAPGEPSQPSSVPDSSKTISPIEEARDHDATTPIRKLGVVRLGHPSVAAETHRANSLAAPERIFSAARPKALIASGPAQPAVPFEFSPAQPSAPNKKIRRVLAPHLASPVAPSAAPALHSSSPSPVAPSEMSTRETVRVQPGDSLWSLAKRILGQGSRWPELLAANPNVSDPLHLSVGSELSVQRARALTTSADKPVTRGVRTVKVQRGDTLWSLARTNLGHAAYWPCLAAANPSLSNPGRILTGQELVLPSTCGSDGGRSAAAASK